MEKKEFAKICIVFVVVFLVALLVDVTNGKVTREGTIIREDAGGEEKTIDLLLTIEGILENYNYTLEIEPTKVTEKQANKYIDQAITSIEKDFTRIKESVPLKEEYAEGLVSAQWNFTPYGYIASDGTIDRGKIKEDAQVINAEVILSCGDYERLYVFPFEIEKLVLSQEEKMLEDISVWIKNQMSQEGNEEIILPTEMNGQKLVWEEEKEYLALKVLILEIASLALIFLVKKKIDQQDDKRIKQQLEEDYPDIVNQLTVLLGAGMTIRQAWNRIANQYTEKRRIGMVEKRIAYEEICYMNRRISEGEKERLVYQNFANRIEVMCFRRLMRLLLSNLEKGTGGLCELLEEECRQAYAKRIQIAKTKGEEASTRMLVPLMIMMILVMAIVLMPAIISFSI